MLPPVAPTPGRPPVPVTPPAPVSLPPAQLESTTHTAPSAARVATHSRLRPALTPRVSQKQARRANAPKSVGQSVQPKDDQVPPASPQICSCWREIVHHLSSSKLPLTALSLLPLRPSTRSEPTVPS